MRTTLTLEPDVAVRLERLRRARDLSFKELVNDALRIGLEQIERPAEPERGEYHSVGWDLGKCRLPDLDDVATAISFGEGDQFK